MLIFKIVPQAEWERPGNLYEGSALDRADGFLHFSTAAQLPQTLARHYAGRDDLLLLTVDTETLGTALCWEHAPARGEDFPHLYAALPRALVAGTKALTRDAHGDFVLDIF
jgi:uncharacterized protein (DUF952 family)